MNLASMDLNLLLVFDAVMAERNATRAGLRVGMSQPAVSNALNRLRHILKDDLFVRGPDGMRPTVRAMELEIPIRRALGEIEGALDPMTFDPATTERTFTIATNDYVAMTLLPYVAEYIAQEAPGVNVHIVPTEGAMYDKIDRQDADFGLTALGEVPDQYGSQAIGGDRFVCLMRKDHPLAKFGDNIPIDEYAAARHLLVSPRGDAHGFIDEKLVDHGLKRRIVVMINSFGPAPMMVANSDMVVTLPNKVADKCTRFFDLHEAPCPISPPSHVVAMMLVWHKRLTNHPAHSWFRDLLMRAGRDLDTFGMKTPDHLLPDEDEG